MEVTNIKKKAALTEITNIKKSCLNCNYHKCYSINP